MLTVRFGCVLCSWAAQWWLFCSNPLKPDSHQHYTWRFSSYLTEKEFVVVRKTNLLMLYGGVRKVKCTLVQALRLCTGRTAHRGSKVAAQSFFTTALEGGKWSASRPGRSFFPGKTRYPLHRRLGGTQGRSEQVRKISFSTGIRSPDRPARSQSLYWLSLPRPRMEEVILVYCEIIT